MPRTKSLCWMAIALAGVAVPARAQFTQAGGKLVGAGYVGAPLAGTSVAISADGSTAVVGGPDDSEGAGAAWVYNTANGTQTKLLGTGVGGFTPAAAQGSSVAVSADGNTVVVGGMNDNGGTGAMWMFARAGAGAAWTQQGGKLWGTVLTGIAHQGISVSLSADGNTALIGGDLYDNYTGAAWVFYRTNGVWSIFPTLLVGAGTAGTSHMGMAVALSADGNTAIVGGPGDNAGAGAVWVFTRSGPPASWIEQGNKLTGSGVSGNSGFGSSVALSTDGNTALIGGSGDNNTAGAVWVFTRSGGQWTQQGGKLVGSDAAQSRYLGQSVALSADGNTALAGGPGGLTGTFGRHPAIGATWVFTRNNGAWTQQGAELVGAGTANNDALQGTSVALSSDGRVAIVGGPVDNNNIGAAWVFAQPVLVSPPAIATQPASQTISSGLAATLSVAASGTPPLAFQWYQGTAGNTSIPVGTNSNSYTTPALTATTSYWVRVTNPYGTADSNTAVVTVPAIVPVITQVFNAASNSAVIAPNTWIAIQGLNLAPAGDTRTWQGSDFVNNQLPAALDGVSATVNGKSGYVYYISPTQVNILTPPDAMQGSVLVQLTRGGVASAQFAATAQPASPGFFVFGAGPYVAAEHAGGSYLGPASLYPGVTTPARPGETVVLYGNGFGPTSPPVTAGSVVQSAPLPTLPVIIIGGTAATVQFAGLVVPGEFQFNVVVPLNAEAGDNTVLAVYNGLTTQSGVLLSVAQ